MSQSQTPNSMPNDRRAAQPTDQDLAGWKERIAGLPDLRLSKVMRLRRSIHANCYNEEDLLERMLDRLHNEIGVLCRDEPHE